jgi:hypothetical protein
MIRSFFARTTAALFLAAAVVAVPVAASAYPADDAASVSSATVEPGGDVTLTVEDGTFEPNIPATVTVTGENGAGVTVAVVRTVVSTMTYRDATTNAAGGVDPLTVTFPQDARGAYTIAVFTASSPGDTVTVTVAGLSATGIDAGPLLGVWIGGGALVAAGAAIAVATTIVRRRRDAA